MSNEKKTTEENGNELDIQTQIIDPVVGQVNDRIEQVQSDVLDRVMKRVDEKFDELAKPDPVAQQKADALFGGDDGEQRSPYVRTGEDPLSSRPYSYFKAMSAVIAPEAFAENAKLEMAVSRQLSDYYDQRNFQRQAIGRKSMLVPFGSSMLPQDFIDSGGKGNDSIPWDQMQSLLRCDMSVQGLKQRMRSKMSQLSDKGQDTVRQALSIFDDSAMGIFTDAQIGEIIELVRATEVFPRIGAREITLPPNGFLPLGRQTGAATGSWLGEGTTISTSEPATGSANLRAKKAGALVLLPNEFFRFSTMDTEGFIRADLSRVLALLIDKAGLEGVGSSNEPLGIIKRSGVVNKTAGTTAANGDTLEPNDPSGLMAEIEENDHDIDGRGFAWIMRGKLWQNILNRRADAVNAGDQAGAYLFAINREAIQNGMPGQMLGWPVVKSSQVSNTRTKGNSSDLTYLLGGIPDDIIIGRVGVLEFTMGTEGTVNSVNMFETDQSAIRAIEHADFAMRHEDSWGFIDDLDLDLPSGAI